MAKAAKLNAELAQESTNPSPKGAGKPVRRLRVYQRAQIAGHVMVHDQSHLFIAPIDNISAGGLFVQNLVSLLAGAEVRVVIKSPNLPEAIQATGHVVRIQKDDRRGLAIEFTSISSRARDWIQDAVYETRMENALKTT